MHPVTPDGRYFVVKGQMRRCPNPSLEEGVRQRLVDALLAARREVRKEKDSEDEWQMKRAPERYNSRKLLLGF